MNPFKDFLFTDEAKETLRSLQGTLPSEPRYLKSYPGDFVVDPAASARIAELESALRTALSAESVEQAKQVAIKVLIRANNHKELE